MLKKPFLDSIPRLFGVYISSYLSIYFYLFLFFDEFWNLYLAFNLLALIVCGLALCLWILKNKRYF